jgi:hypothetical protein
MVRAATRTDGEAMRRFLGSFLAGPAESAGPARLPMPLLLGALAAMLATSAPFWTGPWLGMIDYPNHLARYFLLAHFDELPALAQHYRVHWSLLPNIGSDALVIGLHIAGGWPTERISQVLVGLFSVSVIPAVLLLNRALFGRWSWWPLASAVFVFNYVLLYGFVNYMAGVPLALALAAAWILLRDRPLALLLPIFGLGAILLFLFHLFALGIYALLILGHELVMLARARGARLRLLLRQAIAALHVLPPILLMLAFSPTAGNLAAGRIRWATLGDKATALYSVLSIGVLEVTALSFLVVGAVLGLGLAFRRLVFAPSALVMLGLLTASFLAMPFTLLGSGFADFRLPIVIALVLVAGTRWRGISARTGAILALAIGGVALLRIGTMTQEWSRSNERYAAIMRVMEAMEPGRKVIALIAREDASARFQRRPPLDHAASLAIIARLAFVPSFFAEPEKQPVSFTPEVAPLGVEVPWAIRWRDAETRAALPAQLVPYDYLLLFARTPLSAEPPTAFRRVDDGTVPDVALFAIRPRP